MKTTFTRFTHLRTLALLALIVATARVGNAQISNLFNTGVNPSAVPLAPLSPDPHYALTVTADPNCPTNLAPRVEPHPAWINTNNAISAWIRPVQTFPGFPPTNNFGICGNGNYVYTTSFNVGANANVVINGRATADDLLTAIQLNGGLPLPMSASFAAYQNFTFNSGFNANVVNTLRFFVSNLGGPPTGLRVEMVPEPVWGGWCAVWGLAWLRRRFPGHRGWQA